MKQFLRPALAALAAIALGACAAPAAIAPTTAPAAAATAAVAPTTAPAVEATAPAAGMTPVAESLPAVASPLAGTAWRLTFLGSQAEPEKALTTPAATLSFGADGSLTGATGCGELAGRYTADEAAVAVSDLAVAGEGCTDAAAQAQAERFAELLGAADGFSTEGVVLTVTAGDDALWFQPQP
ncbi:MAG TPA: META domain-containing protein [Chloroflexaceae bacterium]|nr:META domain-containing protein [Chloroflexaceae bacterium]